ncbi:MAG: DUF3052 domain-containing protein [Anaerolineae bacterium]|nr:DUF3052 domain-containing protein [Anaerolineae bacterium]
MSTGYSGKPLVMKLGIKPGFRLIIMNAPPGYDSTMGEMPDAVEQAADLRGSGFDFIQFFTTERAVLENQFDALKNALKPNGMLWISWPKKAAKMQTDLDENIIREIGLAKGLVDVKVAAIDATWSGLKFLFRTKDRSMAY